MGKNIVELNFLKGELEKINNQIKVTVYGGNKEIVEAQIKLWELKEKIEGKIKECEYVEEN
jgi:hypothetical protein